MYVYKKTAADNSVSHFHERASEQPKSCFLFTFSSLASLCHSLHLQWDNPNPTTTPGEWHHQDTTPNISWKNERLDQVLFTLKTSFIFIFFSGKSSKPKCAANCCEPCRSRGCRKERRLGDIHVHGCPKGKYCAHVHMCIFQNEGHLVFRWFDGLFGLGTHSKKITGLFGNFSQMADPPPFLGTPYSKKNYRLFCILGP